MFYIDKQILINNEGNAMQRTAYRAPVRRVRRWVGDIERLEDRLALSSAAGSAIADSSPAVFLNHRGEVSKGHAMTYPFVVYAASYITVDVSNLPHADNVVLEEGGARLGAQTGGANFTNTLQPGTYTVAIKGTKRARFDVTLSYSFVNSQTPSPSTTVGGPPAAPVFTTTPYSASQVSLSWNSVPAATSYQVEIVTGGRWVQLASLSGSTTGCSVPGLSANTTYDFDVVATNASGSNWGIQQFATTLSGGGVPGVPVSSSYSASQVNLVSAIEATWLAPTMLSGVQNLSASYGPVVAADFAEDILSSSNLTNFLAYQGLGSLARMAGVTTLFADDVILDMNYASGHSTLSASTLATNELVLDIALGDQFLDNGQYTPPSTTTNGSPASSFTQTINTLNGLTAINNNANFDWNGNAQLNAEVVSGLAPYGLDQLEASAGLSGLLPSNLFVL
jgi:hypothetical protein